MMIVNLILVMRCGHLVRLSAWHWDGGGGETSVDWPVVPATLTPAAEEVLTLQLPLPLLLAHHCVVVTIVVQYLLTYNIVK